MKLYILEGFNKKSYLGDTGCETGGILSYVQG